MSSPLIAVLLPCHNEGAAIRKVIDDFRRSLPDAEIYVYDNNSTDNTVAEAKVAGAIVRTELVQGKGNVIRRMFADVEADIYLMTDGDDTYDAGVAPAMIDRLNSEQLDMVVAERLENDNADSFRKGHRFGNWLITSTISYLFGKRFSDSLSGYRVLTRRFVKSFPGITSGFDVETELSVHALRLRLPVAEVQSHYRSRPHGSHSKLSTFGDGFRIMRTIIYLLKETRPLFFFSLIGVVLVAISMVLAFPLLETYLDTGLVPRFPTAILSTGIMIIAFLSFACGLILDSVSQGRWEMKRSVYLSTPRDMKGKYHQDPG